jgi:hypothetical protein
MIIILVSSYCIMISLSNIFKTVGKETVLVVCMTMTISEFMSSEANFI